MLYHVTYLLQDLAAADYMIQSVGQQIPRDAAQFPYFLYVIQVMKQKLR